ncbi:hypothetical protein FCV25MIE_24582 [Fagus crenata]
MARFWDVSSIVKGVIQGIEVFYQYKEIVQKRKIAVLEYEKAKMKCELSQRLSMEEKSGGRRLLSLPQNMHVHSLIIKQQRIDERMERIQLHQQAKLGMS